MDRNLEKHVVCTANSFITNNLDINTKNEELNIDIKKEYLIDGIQDELNIDIKNEYLIDDIHDELNIDIKEEELDIDIKEEQLVSEPEEFSIKKELNKNIFNVINSTANNCDVEMHNVINDNDKTKEHLQPTRMDLKPHSRNKSKDKDPGRSPSTSKHQPDSKAQSSRLQQEKNTISMGRVFGIPIGGKNHENSGDEYIEDSDEDNLYRIKSLDSSRQIGSCENEPTKPTEFFPLLPRKSASEPYEEIEENQPFSENIPHRSRVALARKAIWKVIDDKFDPLPKPKWVGDISKIYQESRSPIDYFRSFFDESIMNYIVEQSNIFSYQCNTNKPLNLSKDELDQWLATVIYMSIDHLPRSRMYWRDDLRSYFVSDIMIRDRWEDIKKNLHFNDNKCNDIHSEDKLLKIRPFLEQIRKKFNSIPVDEILCIDEQMIPFRGRSTQYIPIKSHKLGYKFFILADSKGIVYDFIPFTDKILPHPGYEDLGANSNIVLHLTNVIPKHHNHTLVFDNWFTSVPLIIVLKSMGIYSLGTIHNNQLLEAKFISDKELSKKGRGSYQELESTIDGVELRGIKWHDNKCVTLLSSFASAKPVQTCKRFDRSTKIMTNNVPMPYAVALYNKSMGGVDLADELIALYRTSLRSNKWYHRIFFHMLDMCLVNSWLLYRRDCSIIHVKTKEILDLADFKLCIAKSLAFQGKAKSKKRGGPPVVEKPSKKRNLPQEDIRFDNIGHLLVYVKSRGMCKVPGCVTRSNLKCSKCDVHLCCNKTNNCNLIFHTR